MICNTYGLVNWTMVGGEKPVLDLVAVTTPLCHIVNQVYLYNHVYLNNGIVEKLWMVPNLVHMGVMNARG